MGTDCYSPSIMTLPANEVPIGFKKLLESAMAKRGFTLRELARQSLISHAFLSRILSGERGVPSNAVILRLEKVLDIHPPGQLLYEAGRTDEHAKAVLQKEAAPMLMRALAPLTNAELEQIRKVAERIAKDRHPQK